MVQDTVELCNCASQVLHHHCDLVRIRTDVMDVLSRLQVLSCLGELLTQSDVSSFDQENNLHCIDNTHGTGKLLVGIGVECAAFEYER